MSKLAKFFIVCAAVCVLGIMMTFAGYAAGGADNLDKVAEKHDWLNIGPNATETDLLPVGEFKSIEAEGSLDIAIIAPGKDMSDEEVPDFIEDIYTEGVVETVAVKWGNHTGMPEVTNDNGVLRIKGSTETIDGGVVNLSGDDPSPDVIVFCSADELENISVNGLYGDIAIVGVKSKSITATADSGDIELDDVVSSDVTAETQTGDIDVRNIAGSKLTLKANAGDVDIEMCDGEISAETTYGDIEFATNLPQSQYEVSVSTNAGTISIGEEEIESENEFSLAGGPNKLMLRTDTGDIDADFLED